MKRSVAALLFVLPVGSGLGCSPAFWQGFSQGLTGSSSTYGGGYRSTICARYETEAGWSQGYRVQATIIRGSDLNTRTRSYHYNAYSTYVVIFWDAGEASILELDEYYGGISIYGQTAKDQRGRRWQVASGGYCY